jgi:solute carrier family 25 protein 44
VVFAAGGIAGLVQCTIATPMELVRSKLQVQSRHGATSYVGNVDCIRRVVKAEGVSGLYRTRSHACGLLAWLPDSKCWSAGQAATFR